MDGLAPGPGRRRRPEELPVPGDAKRACRRSEASGPEHGTHLVNGCALTSCSPEDLEPQPSGHCPAPLPVGSQGRPRSVIPPNVGRSAFQPCLRCIAGESGHFNHTESR